MEQGVAGVRDTGGFGRPVGIFLQLQSQVSVAALGGLVPSTEKPREESRGPAVIGCLQVWQNLDKSPWFHRLQTHTLSCHNIHVFILQSLQFKVNSLNLIQSYISWISVEMLKKKHAEHKRRELQRHHSDRRFPTCAGSAEDASVGVHEPPLPLKTSLHKQTSRIKIYGRSQQETGNQLIVKTLPFPETLRKRV